MFHALTSIAYKLTEDSQQANVEWSPASTGNNCIQARALLHEYASAGLRFSTLEENTCSLVKCVSQSPSTSSKSYILVDPQAQRLSLTVQSVLSSWQLHQKVLAVLTIDDLVGKMTASVRGDKVRYQHLNLRVVVNIGPGCKTSGSIYIIPRYRPIRIYGICNSSQHVLYLTPARRLIFYPSNSFD